MTGTSKTATVADTGAPDDFRVSVADAARMAGRSPRWLRGLIAAGTIKASGRGAVRLADLLSGLVAHGDAMAKNAAQTTSLGRVQDARAKEVELRVAMQMRELIPMGEAALAMTLICGALNEELSGLPARITRDLTLRKKVDDEIYAARMRIASTLRKISDKLAAGHDLEAK